MGGAGYAGTVGDWIAVCNRIPGSSARNFFEKNFIPFAISVSGKQDGLFTGYYEPELRASRTKHGVLSNTHLWPACRSCSASISACFATALKASTSRPHRRSSLVPYATRAEIDANELQMRRCCFTRTIRLPCSSCTFKVRAGFLSMMALKAACELCRAKWQALHGHRPYADRAWRTDERNSVDVRRSAPG